MGKRQMTKQEPDMKLVHHRMSALQLAEDLGNISAACRCTGMSRSSFYQWKKRFQTQGMEGLKDLPPVPWSHPQATPSAVEQEVIAVSLAHPDWGCVRLAAYLKSQEINISSPTIQKILLRHDLGMQYQRWSRLEEQHLREGIALTPQQIRKIEQYNPCFKERCVQVYRPGELLVQDSFYAGTLVGLVQIYLHVVVDMYNSFAFGRLYPGKSPAGAVAVLRHSVLPFYRVRKITIRAVLTDNGQEFNDRETQRYDRFLLRNGIRHRCTMTRNPTTNGFIKRFKHTALNEFFCIAFQAQPYYTVEALQADFDNWVYHYNYERPHFGYCNWGLSPIARITVC